MPNAPQQPGDSPDAAARPVDLRSVFEAAIAGIRDQFAAMDRDWRYLFVNDALCEATAKKREELIGHVLWDVFPAVLGTEFERLVRRTMDEKIPCAIEHFYAPRGKWRYVRAQPTEYGLNFFVEDITARKEAEQQVRDREASFFELVDRSPLSMQLVDLSGRTVRVNAAWEQLWNLKAESLRDYNMLQDPQLEAAGIATLIRRAMKGEVVSVPAIEYDPRVTLPNEFVSEDPTRWVSAAIYPLRNAAAEVINIVLVHEDVTVRTRAERALRASEKRFRAFVTASGDLIYRMSPDWGTMWMLEGKNFVANTSQPTNDWLQRYVPPDDHRLVLKHIEDAIAKRGFFELEHRVIHADGAIGWTHSRAVPVLDENGAIEEWIGVASNITDRRAAQAEVERLTRSADQERRLYHAIIATTPDLAYVFDLDHRLIYANPAVLAAWRKTTPEVLGKTILHLGLDRTEAEKYNQEIAQAIQTKKPVRRQSPVHTADGRRIYDYIFVPVLSPGGDVEAIAGTARDVTEMAEAREILARDRQDLERLVDERTAKLKQALQQMEEFSYSVSHDVRAPIRAVRGYAESILEDFGATLPPDVLRLLQRIAANAQRLDRLTQDVLTYTKAARSLELSHVPLDRLTREIIASYPQLHADRADVHIPAALPDVIGHEPSLSQVVSNLLINAVKFVRPNTRPSVTITAQRNGGRVRVRIQDNGIGILPEHQKRLFGMFERLHPEGKCEGTGIGLAIVRKSIERMHGTVGVESDGTAGSCFWFELSAADA